ncbi:PREDICTED: perilipin-3-like [Pseudopodoces humilis]|uniref:perilipin-3-like n=1 Tax=Pseudopodoces humilis TaxID=181119 RepID=UPI0006B6FC14|nr:PREDICTED: perilipin-3-like [Pseudopodoces humilis]
MEYSGCLVLPCCWSVHLQQVKKAAMASAVPDKEEVAQSSPEEEEEQEAVVKEVANLSLVGSACDVVSAAYASSKESHPYVRSMCDAAEKGVQSVSEATASCVQPVLATLEPHVAAVSEYASKGLDKLGEKLPLLQKPVEQILSGTKELVSSRVAEVKEAVSSKVLQALDVSREAVQSSEGAAGPAVTGLVLEPGAGVCGAEAVLGRDKGDSLPIGNEELAQLAVCEEGTEALPLEQQREQRRYFVRLGSLSEELRLFAHLHATARIQQVWQGMQGALAQLRCILELIEAFKQGFNQKLQEGQEKLHQMWLDWSRKYLKESGDESSVEPEELESLTLLMARRVTQQLHLTCCGVVAAVQGLPCSLQDKLKRAPGATKELHAAFSLANSFQDLSSGVLSQSQRELAVIQEYMEELLHYLKNNTPLSWLVGPFSPRGEEEDQSSQEEEAAGAGHLETSSTPM